jgi:hypothetical protein
MPSSGHVPGSRLILDFGYDPLATQKPAIKDFLRFFSVT